MTPYLKLTLWYLAFGAVWIFVSDRVLESFAGEVSGLTFLQTIKGWLFVSASGLLIFFLTRKAFKEQHAQEKARLEIFEKTVEGSHHILLNYLNQMQLVTLEAQNCEAFDKSVLEISNEVSEQAAAELAKLANVENLTCEGIEEVVYHDLRGDGRKGR